jgi:hypothetical protein
MTIQENLGNEHCEAFNPSLEHRLSHGLTFQANYTLAKNIGDVFGDAPTTYGNEISIGINDHFNLHNIRGNEYGARHQRFLVTVDL